MTAKEIKRQMNKKRTKEKPLASKASLQTGVTLLNLLFTGNHRKGIPKGSYMLMVGDSAAGKTVLCLNILTVAANSSKFDDYRLIHDDAEGGAQMDKELFFGKKAAERIEPPNKDGDGQPIYSETVDEFYDHVEMLLDNNVPFIYAMDSQDVLTSAAEIKKIKKQKTARRTGADEGGSMTDAKAKVHSQRLRQIVPRLRKSGSILIILSQTRDNLGFGSQFNPKVRAGGTALRFYADLEIWLSIKKRLKKTVRKKDRKIGVLSTIATKKNRINGREGSIDIPILYSHGIDNTGSCVDYLVDEGHWKKTGETITAPEFEEKTTREKLIRLIEEGDYEKELSAIVGEVWSDIDEASKVVRKRKYE